jgi:hypothetical protein
MYIRVQTHPTLGELVGPFEGTFIGSLLGGAEIFLFLNDRLGGGRHQVTYRTEDPPAKIELYPYDRVATQVFKLMDGPAKVAVGAKGKWIRFDVDVGWLFWLRVVNGRTELKLAPETQATFGQIQYQLSLPGQAKVSVELADAPEASTSTGRVFLWLIKYISGIVNTEQEYHIDRRAIAGAISWEALLNPKDSLSAELRTATGTARFSGPGKVHYKESFLPTTALSPPGVTAAIEIEQRGKLPVKTEEQRRQVLATTPGALSYIGTIMRECSDIAAQGGYYLDCDPPSLTTFYNSWDIHEVERLFSQRRVPAALTPNEMGTWVTKNMAFIEMAVGKPPAGFCKKPRGY